MDSLSKALLQKRQAKTLTWITRPLLRFWSVFETLGQEMMLPSKKKGEKSGTHDHV